MYKLLLITIYTIIFYFLCYKITNKNIDMTKETINMFKTDFYTSFYFIIVFICLLISIVYYLFFSNYWLINIYDIFPILLLFISGIIEYNAILNLNENYYPQVGPEKRIVQSGIYKIIRHPIYLCAILFSSSIILLLSKNIYLFLIVPIIIVVIIKVEHEDNYLLKKHKIYKKYKNKTYKLIPFVY
jgi:protein-S-isoprenylcysteine O-methyltransferase Ste14